MKLSHKGIINNKLISIYLFGSYCKLEVDIKPINICIQLFTNRGWFNHFSTRI